MAGRSADLVVPGEAHFFPRWWMILRNYFPAAVRSQWRAVSLSVRDAVGGLIFGFAATWANPRSAAIFLPPEHLQETPRACRPPGATGTRRQVRNQHRQRAFAFDDLFVQQQHPRWALGFAFGLTFGIGTVIVLFYNGAMLGSLAALYFMDGVGKFFVAWVGPHGSIELPCTVLGCAAGFMLAARQLRRGDTTMMAQMRDSAEAGGYSGGVVEPAGNRRHYRGRLQPDQRTDDLLVLAQDRGGGRPVHCRFWRICSSCRPSRDRPPRRSKIRLPLRKVHPARPLENLPRLDGQIRVEQLDGDGIGVGFQDRGADAMQFTGVGGSLFGQLPRGQNLIERAAIVGRAGGDSIQQRIAEATTTTT